MDFWRPDRWLPRDVEWDQVPPKFADLVYPIYFAVPMVVIRIFFEAFVGITLGHLLGYKGKTSLFYDITDHLFGGFARNTKTKRVLECFWRFSYYLFAFVYGCIVMYDKSWLWDVKQCWIGYPFHKVDNEVWWYYTIETAFYYSLLIASVFDVRRSDFWQLIVHHVVTIGLLSTSWTINFVRVGTLILISHDVADVLLEAGKLVRYSRNSQVWTNIIFVLFLLSWIVTRLGYYPMVVIRSGLTEAAGLIQPDYELWNLTMVPYVPRFIILLLVVLLFLHVFWTFIIMKVVYRTITQGEAADVRSDSEEDYDNEKSIEERKKLLKKTKLYEKSNGKSNGKSNRKAQHTDDSEDESDKTQGSPTTTRRRVRKAD